MPFLRRLSLAILIVLAGVAGALRLAAADPVRIAATPELNQLRQGGAQQQQGGQLDHAGTRANSRPGVIKILKAAAVRHQLEPRLVVALSYWESGWDQSKVSVTGAVGLMQVEPPTAAEAGPALLGRSVNLADPMDNADVGAAVLREDLNSFGAPDLALAAYYQGPTSLRANGMLPDTQAYVAGILSLTARLNV